MHIKYDLITEEGADMKFIHKLKMDEFRQEDERANL
jgi:hypothetical protein